MARGEVLTFLDADDRWPEGNLDRSIGYLSDHPEAETVMMALWVAAPILVL